MKAARIENGIVADLWEVPSLDCYEGIDLVEAPNVCAVGWLFEAGVGFTPPQKPLDEVKADLVAAVQAHLDAAAKAKGYDNIVSACSYAAAPNPYQAEGAAFIAWRGAVWQHCYQVVGEVESGARPVPTAEELLGELPEVTWPAPI